MSDELKQILTSLHQYRDLVQHEGTCLDQSEIDAYKHTVTSGIDKLINDVANGNNTRTEPVLPLQRVSQRSEQFSLKQLWIMAQKLNMSDFKQMVEEIERLNCG